MLKYSLRQKQRKKEAYDYGYDNDAEDPGCTRRIGSCGGGAADRSKLDVVMANDITGPMAIPVFKQMAEKYLTRIK